MALQIRRGTNSERLTIIPLQGELIYTTDTKKVYVGDGLTPGGILITGSGNGEDMTDEEIQALVAAMFTDGTHTGISFTYNSNNGTINATVSGGGGGGTGTVTSVSVVTANGFAGTVNNPTTTPAITLSTNITGLIKGNGSAISAAAAGIDYQAPITLTTTGSSGAATLSGNILNIPQYSGGTEGGAVNLSELEDVNLGTLVQGQVLSWNGEDWTNTAVSFDLEDDISPSLGGPLELNEYNIGGIGNISITGSIVSNTESSANINFSSTHFSDDDAGSLINFRKARGTRLSPQAIQANDRLSQINFLGYDGANYVAAGIIEAVSPLVDSGIVEGRLRFVLADIEGAYKETLRLDSFGCSIFGRLGTAAPMRIFNNHDTAALSGNLIMLRSRGTFDNPIVVQNNDRIAGMTFSGYDGTTAVSGQPSYPAVGQIRVNVDGTVAPNQVPGRMELATANSSGSMTVRLRLTSDGKMHVNDIRGLTNNYVSFSQMPALPTYADEAAADAAIGGVGNRVNGMMYYDSGATAIKAVVNGSWTSLTA